MYRGNGRLENLLCCITFKHIHVRNIQNRYIRDLDMQFMRSETGKIGIDALYKGRRNGVRKRKERDARDRKSVGNLFRISRL